MFPLDSHRVGAPTRARAPRVAPSGFDLTAHGGLLVLDLFIDGCFICDIIACFRTAFLDEHGDLVEARRLNSRGRFDAAARTDALASHHHPRRLTRNERTNAPEPGPPTD